MNSKMKKLLVNAAMAGMIAGVGTMGAPTASATTKRQGGECRQKRL